MDKLSKAQKDEYATVFAMLALYDGGVSSYCIVVAKAIQFGAPLALRLVCGIGGWGSRVAGCFISSCSMAADCVDGDDE